MQTHMCCVHTNTCTCTYISDQREKLAVESILRSLFLHDSKTMLFDVIRYISGISDHSLYSSAQLHLFHMTAHSSQH